jgi:hypothetical protein
MAKAAFHKISSQIFASPVSYFCVQANTLLNSFHFLKVEHTLALRVSFHYVSNLASSASVYIYIITVESPGTTSSYIRHVMQHAGRETCTP